MLKHLTLLLEKKQDIKNSK